MNGTLRANGAKDGPPRTDKHPLVLAPPVAATLKAQRGKAGGGISPEETFIAAPLTARSATGRIPGRSLEDDVNLVAGTLRSHPRPGSADPGAIAFSINLRGRADGNVPEIDPDDLASVRSASGGSSRSFVANQVGTLTSKTGALRGDASDAQQYVGENATVRRLTPVECERLQGFPDNWTRVPGLKCPDGRRYAAMGNAVTVNVAEWIGRRIVALDEIDRKTTTTP